MRRILAIETSCDETAAAVVEAGRVVRSNVVASQVDLHARFGGVFPEMASRQHVRDIAPVVEAALLDAGVALEELDGIAVTRGPGLSGALLVGVNFAKGLALALGAPLVGVNHLAGHLYSNWLHVNGRLRSEPTDAEADPRFPYLALIVSGGHTDLVHVRGHGDYARIGSTLDDAAGEAFDKAARMLGLGYPGGPAIERIAANGNAAAFDLPVAATASPLDFSFSGLKSAVLRVVEAGTGSPADIAASFQEAAVAALVSRVGRALDAVPAVELHVSGGVSANGRLRAALAATVGIPIRIPPLALCTDNAAMIAAAAYWAPEPTTFDMEAEPSLSLAEEPPP